MRALAAAACLLVFGAGCTTVTPLQTATVVPRGGVRLGAQAGVTPYCSLSASPLNSCALVPDGIPTPELRASARYGFADRTDAGLSLHGGAVVPRGASLGVLLDVKRELWTREADGGRRHLVSASVGLGARTDAFGIFGGSAPGGTPLRFSGEYSGVLAGWYGYQTQSWEWVASPRFVERLGFYRVREGSGPEAVTTEWLGLSVAAISRGKVRFALGVDYLAPLSDLATGPFTVSVGALWDLGQPARE